MKSNSDVDFEIFLEKYVLKEKYGIKFKGGTKNERCFKGNGRKKKYS